MKPLLSSRPFTARRRTALAVATVAALAALPFAGRLAAQTFARYTNPVIDRNFPDPSILSDRGIFYAYATNDGANMLAAYSTDLTHWSPLPDAMPKLPPWVQPGRTWAPNVATLVTGRRYVAYFTARDREKNTEAIGVATASTPAGPFTSQDTQPLIDQADMGGCIDPSCFTDTNGSHYLIWKNDGNSKGQDTWLWIQPLAADGVHLMGVPKQLIRQDQLWEGSLIEAPTLWKHGSKYYLFYSANAYNTCKYAVGYAVADKLDGPYVKPRTTPWLASTPDVCGPGGEDIVVGKDGKTWMAYHFWKDGPHSARVVGIDPLVWNADVPYLLGPSRWPQPAPVPVTPARSGR